MEKWPWAVSDPASLAPPGPELWPCHPTQPRAQGCPPGASSGSHARSPGSFRSGAEARAGYTSCQALPPWVQGKLRGGWRNC